MGAHRDWPEFAQIIGGRCFFSPQTLGGEKYGLSTYAHEQDINVKVKDRNHPIMEGISDFQIHDETYKNYFTSQDVHVLLTTDHPKSDREIAWVTQYGKSHVFYLLLGHDSQAWKHPLYSKLLLNAIRWAASQSTQRFKN